MVEDMRNYQLLYWLVCIGNRSDDYGFFKHKGHRRVNVRICKSWSHLRFDFDGLFVDIVYCAI